MAYGRYFLPACEVHKSVNQRTRHIKTSASPRLLLYLGCRTLPRRCRCHLGEGGPVSKLRFAGMHSQHSYDGWPRFWISRLRDWDDWDEDAVGTTLMLFNKNRPSVGISTPIWHDQVNCWVGKYFSIVCIIWDFELISSLNKLRNDFGSRSCFPGKTRNGSSLSQRMTHIT